MYICYFSGSGEKETGREGGSKGDREGGWGREEEREGVLLPTEESKMAHVSS